MSIYKLKDVQTKSKYFKMLEKQLFQGKLTTKFLEM